MDLMQIVLVLLIVGMVLWAVDRWVPMADAVRKIMNAVVVVLVIVWLITVFAARFL